MPTSVALALISGLALSPLVFAGDVQRFVDLSGDDLPDRVVFQEDGHWQVELNMGSREFAVVDQQLPAVRMSDLLVTDLDLDGNQDLYVLSSGSNMALLGDGSGRLFEATDALGLADGGRALSARSLDADGDRVPDLLVRNASGDVLFWGSVHGRFSRAGGEPLAVPAATLGFGSSPQPGGARPSQPLSGGTPPPPAVMLSAEQAAILDHMSLVFPGDEPGVFYKTLRVEGLNVQIVSGSGATNGNVADPITTASGLTSTNGLGNLILGYNEPRPGFDERGGSHNLVLAGVQANYTSFGGLVGGRLNEVSAPSACALSGEGNVASGLRSVVLTGWSNTASGRESILGSGEGNAASGVGAVLLSGLASQASGPYSLVGTGTNNVASGGEAAVLTGNDNTSQGFHSAAVAGSYNDAVNTGCTVLGGIFGTATGNHTTVLGGDSNSSSGFYSVNVGGFLNVATGNWSVLGGGNSRSATGEHDWVAGTLFEDQ